MSTQTFPKAKQTEFSVIALLIRHPKNIETALSYSLDIDCFYEEATRNIFVAVERLHRRKAFIDQYTLIDELDLMKVTIKQEQLNELITKKAEHSDALIGYIDQLKELRRQRCLIEVIKLSEEIALTDKTADEKLELIMTSFSKVSNDKVETRTFNESSNYDSFLATIQNNIENKGKNIVKTGFQGLDSQISLIPGTVHFIGGIPGSGKTALVQQIVDYNALHGKNVMVFSIEMIYEQLMMRKIQSALNIPTWKMHTGNLTQDEIDNIVDYKKMLHDNVTYNDTSNIDISRLKAVAHVENSKAKIDLIVIDYLQLIRVASMKNKREDEEIKFISAELLGLAKDLNVPIISLAQLNREWKNNDGKRPEASNLAGGSSLEKDAASIVFIHRPGQHDPTSPKKEETELIIAKNRFGNSNLTKIRWNGPACKFEDYSEIELAEIEKELEVLEFEGEKKAKKKKSFAV